MEYALPTMLPLQHWPREANISLERFFTYSPTVDERFFNTGISDSVRLQMREQLNAKDKFVLLYHGHTHLARGIIETIRAVKEAHGRGLKEIMLIILGTSSDDQKILRYVEENKLRHLVSLCPPVKYDVVAKYIAASDLGVIPFPDHVWFREASPIKILECLSMGLPVLCTDLPGLRWVSQFADGAIVFTQDNIDSRVEGVM